MSKCSHVNKTIVDQSRTPTSCRLQLAATKRLHNRHRTSIPIKRKCSGNSGIPGLALFPSSSSPTILQKTGMSLRVQIIKTAWCSNRSTRKNENCLLSQKKRNARSFVSNNNWISKTTNLVDNDKQRQAPSCRLLLNTLMDLPQIGSIQLRRRNTMLWWRPC